MATISRTGISNTSTIDAEHITRIIDALDGATATEVVASGSFSGSFTGSHVGDFSGDGTNITGVTAEWDGTHNGNAQITGSLVITANLTASGNISSSGDITAANFDTVGKVTADISITTPIVKSATSVLQVLDNLDVVGHMTASGNVSASGNIVGTDITVIDDLFIKDSIYSVGADDPSIKLNAGATNFDVDIGDVDGASAETIFKVKDSNQSFQFLNGNVTASIISASVGFIGDLTGNAITATTATNATNVAITTENSNAAFNIHFGNATSGNDGVNVTSSLSFNPGIQSGVLTVGALANVKTTHVTASGFITAPNISASVEISAARYVEAVQDVAAAGNNQDSATQIAAGMSRVFVTSADNSKGVKLPLVSAVSRGTTYTIHNTVSNRTLEVYPGVDDNLLPMLPTNGPATVPAGAVLVVTKYTDLRWLCYFGGAIS